MSALTRKSIADITRRKGRTLLVMLSILIGVFGLTAVNVANESIGEAFAYTRDQSAIPDIVFMVGGYNPAMTQNIAAHPNVEKVQTRVEFTSNWLLADGKRSVALDVWGYDDFQAIQLQPFQLTSGRLPTRDGEIAMESMDRAYQSISVGDAITVAAANHKLVRLQVVGLGRTRGIADIQQGPGKALGYMNATALRLLGQGAVNGTITKANKTDPRLLTGLEIRVKQMNQVGQTADEIKSMLQNNHAFIVGFDDMNYNYASATVDGVLNIVRVLSLIALFLSCILIMNTVAALVSEQTHIIGTMKALGGTRWRIVGSYLLTIGLYSIPACLCGTGLGIAGGWLLASLLAGLVTLDLGPFQPSLWLVFFSLVAGLLVPQLAALMPLWTGTRITVRQAISAYGVSRGSQREIGGAFGHGLIWVPQTVWLGLRGIFRKPGRAALTLIALTCSGIAFTAVQINNDSVNYTLERSNNIFRTDVELNLNWLSLNEYPDVRQQLLAIPNVAYVEPLYASGNISVNGQHFPVWGLESDTHVYPYHLIAGRWFRPGEQDVVVLGQKAAQNMHVQVGSSLSVASGASGNKATWRVVGIVDDLNPVDIALSEADTPGSAYAPIDSQANLAQTHGIHYVEVEGRDRSEAAVKQMAQKISDFLNNTGHYGSVETRMEITAETQSAGEIVSIILDGVVIIVALVAVLGLFNTLLISVLERQKEIGILRSMGAIGRRIATVFLIEGLTLVLLAWSIGMIVGIPVGYVLLQVFSQLLKRFEFFFSPSSLILMLICALVVTFLASVGPALSASRLRIHEVLRYE